MSLKYGIPVEVALAMWKVEGNYGTAGASVANKNPGNLRDSQFAAGTNGGFALFDSWKAGIEGFFDLLRHNTHGYDTDVDKYKGGDTSALLDLIKTYAPKLRRQRSASLLSVGRRHDPATARHHHRWQ
jgi:hypothetical protein